jgi:ribonuclease D
MNKGREKKRQPMISTAQEFQELIARAMRTDCVGLDTEFVWERTYYPNLGLIQLALSDEECFLIDPMAIDDLSVLGELLSSRKVVKILHDAPQDLTILSRATGAIPRNIFDTRVAAGFSGLSSTISLADLIATLLDIDLKKTQTRTDWLKRPLDEKQISYALDDVRYLRALRVLLLSRIVVPEIKEWLKEELSAADRADNLVGIDDQQRFLRIKGSGSLDPVALSILKELATWREQEARHINRPRGHVIADNILLSIARDRIDSTEKLKQSALLSAKKLRRYDQKIINCIKTGLSVEAEDRPEPRRPLRLNAREKTAYERLSSFVALKCELQGLDPALIATTSELKQLAKNIDTPGSPLPEKLTGGWRKTFLEEFFRQRR